MHCARRYTRRSLDNHLLMLYHHLQTLCWLVQVSSLPDKEVPEEAQCQGLATSDCIKQRQEVGSWQCLTDIMRNLFCLHQLMLSNEAHCRVYELRYFKVADNEGKDEE